MSDLSIYPEGIGIRIRTLRKNAKKTQSHFADMLYISPSYLALIESGKRTPTVEILAQISKLCDVSIDYLIFGEASLNYDTAHQTLQRLMDTYAPNDITKALRLAEFYLNLDTKEKRN